MQIGERRRLLSQASLLFQERGRDLLQPLAPARLRLECG